MPRRLPLVVLAVVVALAGAACADDPPLETESLEEQIATAVTDAYAVEATSVVCPEEVEVEAGGTFTCLAEIDGRDFKVTVDQGDDPPQTLTFTNTQALITPEAARVGAELKAVDRLGFGVTADCGDRVIIGRPGKKFDCTLTEQSGTTVVATFEITDVRGAFEFAE